MASQRGPVEPFKRLLPQSWFGWLTAVLLTIVTVTHPGETWHVASSTVWGAGRWVGYELFAHCDEPAPFSWMSPKRCPAPADQPPPTTTEASSPVATAPAWLERFVEESKGTAEVMSRRRTVEDVLPSARKQGR